MATPAHTQPQADFAISIDLIQAGMGFAVSMTIDDRRGLTTRINLATDSAEQFAKAILIAIEQAKTKLVIPN